MAGGGGGGGGLENFPSINSRKGIFQNFKLKVIKNAYFQTVLNEFSSPTHCYYISHEMFTIYCGYFPVYSKQ